MAHGSFRCFQNGRPAGMMDVEHDMTDEHQTGDHPAEELRELRVRVDKLTKTEAELREALRTLQETAVFPRALLDSVPDLAWIKDSDGKFVLANEAFVNHCGVSHEELIGKSDFDFWPRELAARYLNDDLEVMRTGRSKKIEETLVHTSKGEIWIETIKSPVRNEAGQVIGVAGIARNISQRKRSVEELARSEAKYRELVQNAKSIIMRFDRQGKITFFNEYAQEFFGFTEQEILGRHVIGSIVPPTESTGRDLAAMIQYLIAEPDRHSLNENENIRSSGERVWIAWTNHGLSSSSGHVTEILSVGTDISALKKAEAKLRELAITDGLTGLFNRRHFMDLCSIEIDRARRYGHSLSLLMMDIDFFKSVNDKHGHGVGDETLRFVSGIAASNLRKTDIIGRLGGEEFGLLLLETDLSGARMVGEKVRQSIEQAELNTDLGPLRITVSIGVASRSDRELDIDSLFILADKALYSAKKSGRNRVEVA